MNWHKWFVDGSIAGNAPWRVAAFAVVLLIALVAGKIARHALLAAAAGAGRKDRRMAEAAFRAMASAAGFVIFAFCLELGFDFLTLNPKVEGLVKTVCGVTVVCALAWAIYCLVAVVDAWLMEIAVRSKSRMGDMLAPLVRKSLRITVVLLALLQVATILSDKPVTSLIAGLGVGSLAIALAAQDSIKNFFGSIVLFSDKPFEIGDRITVDGHDGPVEAIGLRSTRIRTLDGHLVTIPNGELANKTIKNIGRRPYIRRLMNIAVTYDTPPEKVARAAAIVKEILENHEGMHPDFPPRVCFNEFNDCSLNILVIYWYHPPDYWAFMNFSERVNLEILSRFNAEGIDFAFPTRTLFLASDPNRPLGISGLEKAGPAGA